ncbi:aldo/keto reductase [Jiangella rhizosphaerae]|uniref:Aldo/keto reductase n=1 Tax=Jiangella rhizosphaerae TaxID=2293569 RepID=A0A418KNR5_9ACTN|nr:aldo/keto reductase [Jiangella rhizosphaerae]RIQ20599.1 aldo/keto reductase [Jiangella rhizosphaerae]
MTTRAPRLVLGAAQIGQPYGRSGRPAPSDAEVRRLLTLATRLGCAAVDTARAYGGSEAAIGRARASGAGAALPVVTKIRPLTDDDVAAGLAAAVTGSLAVSLTALRAGRVDTVLLHRARDLHRAGGAAAAALRSAQERGLLSQWGASVAAPDELLAALAVPGLGYVQLPFNLLDRRWLAGEVQAALAARPDVTVVARSSFLQGILLRPDPSTWPVGGHPDAAVVRTSLTALAGDLGRTTAGLCLGYVLGQPWIDAAVVGVRSAEQLLEVAGECALPPLSADKCEQVTQRLPAGSPELVDPARWTARVTTG